MCLESGRGGFVLERGVVVGEGGGMGCCTGKGVGEDQGGKHFLERTMCHNNSEPADASVTVFVAPVSVTLLKVCPIKWRTSTHKNRSRETAHSRMGQVGAC